PSRPFANRSLDVSGQQCVLMLEAPRQARLVDIAGRLDRPTQFEVVGSTSQSIASLRDCGAQRLAPTGKAPGVPGLASPCAAAFGLPGRSRTGVRRSG